jgi:signal transduction histidine kinase/DNA-binding NarL/FixJ family response regulator
MRSMSLRLKVVIILTVACGLGDALLITLWQPWYLSQALNRERMALQGHLVTLGDAAMPFLLQNQIGAVYEIFDATLERQPEWRSLVLRDADNVVIYPLEVTNPGPTENSVHMTHAIQLRNSQLGQIELVADLSNQVSALRQDFWMILGVVTLGFAMAGLLIGMTLELVIGRRTRALVTAAERVGQGDFSAHVTEGHADEIGMLARAFNSMRESIAANDNLLIEARQAAERSDHAKSAFLATMSHEIRTPMNGILGMAQLLGEQSLPDRERIDYARTILNSGKTLLTLLNDILDISKIEAGRLELEASPFDPAQLLGETQSLFSEYAEGKGLRTEATWDGPPGCYRGDPHRLRQMLANLVGNAVKFTKQGHIRIEGREIARDERGALLEFSVTDTGIGISEDKQTLLFQPFSQVDSSTTRQFGGTGLGLSIVRSLAHLMGGEAGVESQPGSGARFWFRIPAEPAECPAPAPGSESAEALMVAEPAKRLQGRVLLVEDNPINRKVAEAILRKLGLSVATAEDGRQATEMIGSGNVPDLVLMDVQMPVMDGYSATEWIRHWEAEGNRPRLPIIALTANAFAEDRQRCLDVGMDDYLSKPIVLDALKAMLEKWLPPSITPATSPASPLKAADLPAIRHSLAEIIPLLEQNRFDALGKFGELQTLLADTEFAMEVNQMRKSLDQLDFDRVRRQLVRLADSQHWQE